MAGYVVLWNGRGAMPHQRDDDPAWMCRESRLVQAAPGRQDWPTQWETRVKRSTPPAVCACGAVLSRRETQLKFGQCWTCRLKTPREIAG